VEKGAPPGGGGGGAKEGRCQTRVRVLAGAYWEWQVVCFWVLGMLWWQGWQGGVQD